MVFSFNHQFHYNMFFKIPKILFCAILNLGGSMDYSKYIRNLKDYPKEGIIFRDITTLLKDKDAFRGAIDELVSIAPKDVDKVVGVEARGFIVGAPIALGLDAGFVPVRKPGKLPYKKIEASYELEYGTDTIEIHEDAISPGEKVIIVDDLLATGGTSKATIDLIERLGGKVEALVFLVELTDLPGREVLEGYDVRSLVKY